MQRRTTYITASDEQKDLTIIVMSKRKHFSTDDARAEASDVQKLIEDQIVEHVFLPRFYARNIKIKI